MSCTFTVVYTQPKEELIEKLKDAVSKYQGTFNGNTTSGELEIPIRHFGIFLGLLKASYAINGDDIVINILQQPIGISCERIKKEIIKDISANSNENMFTNLVNISDNLSLHLLDKDSIAALKESVKQNIDSIAVPTEEELEENLGTYYEDSLRTEASSMNYTITLNANYNVITNGKKILETIKAKICQAIQPSSDRDKIIDEVTDAVVTLLPNLLAKFAKIFIPKLAKFILDKGYHTFCEK